MANNYSKQLVSMLTLIATLFNAQAFGACDQVVCANVVKTQKICTDVLVVKSDCGACHNISAKDFMDAEGNLSQTVVIDQPGKWCLCENIDFNPSPNASLQPAIQILSSDVYLDLGKYTLRQANPDIADIYGIQIGEGYLTVNPELHFDNITVTNGTIIAFTAAGIQSYNPTFDFLEEPFPYNSFNFTHLNILDCGSHPSFEVASGIALDSAASGELTDPATVVSYRNLNIDNCGVNECLGNTAINVYTFDNLVINNTQANNFVQEINVGTGCAAYSLEGRNLQMLNCQGNGTSSPNELNNVGVYGIFILNSINGYLKNNQFNDTYGESSSEVINRISNSSNFIVENCQFNNFRGGANASQVYGFSIDASGVGQTLIPNGMKFINCQFNGARVSDESLGNTCSSMIGGFLADAGNNIILEKCQFCDIITNNPGFHAWGVGIITLPFFGTPTITNIHNITLSNCVLSDITGGRESFGIRTGGATDNLSGLQSSQMNVVIENCILERINNTSEIHRVAGIGSCLLEGCGQTGPYPISSNLLIENCRLSDVHSLSNNARSSGILIESTNRPSIINNSISDCDRGLLLTGTSDIIPNGFQLAATLEDALAEPPISVPLNVQLKVFTNPALPGAPFDALLASYSPPFMSTTGLGAVTNPLNACVTVLNDLTNQIGICRRGGCDFIEKTANIEDQGGVGTIVIQNPDQAIIVMSSPFGQVGNYPSVMISFEDGTTLMDAINGGQEIQLTIDTIPSAGVNQTFMNLINGSDINFDATNVDTSGLNFIYPDVDMNTLNWQSGDPIYYDCNGFDPIPDLVCSTTYYAIVYLPGYARNGVIMNNTIDNCEVSGYQDDAPTTSSAWVNNFAFNNGTPASALDNYDINWSGTAPVYSGDLSDYPTGSAKTYNVSLIP